ncbi:MAG: hypothetical protein M1827_006535 [Pycnora praestabilis]|nr:MAG: hypothetical protein M1827_006535 [Pycnora praestabilis]
MATVSLHADLPTASFPAAELKQHTSCDECRARKVKCSGEQQPTGCSRCRREALVCKYSVKKQMGRPRKRKSSSLNESDTALPSDVATKDVGSFHNIDPSNGNLTAVLAHDNSIQNKVLQAYDTMSTVKDWTSVPSEHCEEISALPAETTQDHFMGKDALSDIPQYIWPDQMPMDLLALNPTVSQATSVSTTSGPVTPKEDTACACLPSAYLTLSSLQAHLSSPSAYLFPFSLSMLRDALGTARTLIRCPHCPLTFSSGVQNLMLLGTLFPLITEGFGKMLRNIDQEAVAMEATNATKRFRMGDMTERSAHLHTGTLDCPAAFEIELDTNQWRQMARSVIRSRVLGLGTEHESLSGLVDELSRRQETQHTSLRLHPDDIGNSVACNPQGGRPETNGDFVCLRILDNIRKMVKTLGLE